MNCRDVSAEAWQHAREVLTFYFSRRYGASNAEDITQETLAAVWSHDQFSFRGEEDFLRVCYGFGRFVVKEVSRKQKKHQGEALSPVFPAAVLETNGLKDTEIDLFLQEVIQVGREKLKPADWELIWQTASGEGRNTGEELAPQDKNTLRVRLHRARKRLAALTGWRKEV